MMAVCRVSLTLTTYVPCTCPTDNLRKIPHQQLLGCVCEESGSESTRDTYLERVLTTNWDIPDMDFLHLHVPLPDLREVVTCNYLFH